MNVKIITTARALILNEKKELLLVSNGEKQNGKLLWFTPGGWLDGFEKLEETCKREIFEETGLEIEVIKLYKIDYFQLTVKQNIKWKENINKIEHYFLCKIVKGKILSTKDDENLWQDEDVGNTKFIKFFSKEEFLLKNNIIVPNWVANEFLK